MGDDSTAANQIPRRNHSGEWSALDEVLTRLDRIEVKVDRNFSQTSALREKYAVLETRLTTIEDWKSEYKAFGAGVWLSLISAVASPIATFFILHFR